MKKIFCLLVCFNLIFSLTGCGSDNSEKIQEKPIQKTESKVNDKKKVQSYIEVVAELPDHPRLYGKWKEVKSFYKKNDMYEKYVYVSGESPGSFYEKSSISFYDSKDIVHEIHIKPQKIWGNVSLEETFKVVKSYVPENSSTYMLIDRKQLIPETINTDRTSYYWLHYGKEKSRYGDKQYNITFYVKDGYVTEIILSESPYNMFTDSRKSKGWTEENWDTRGIF